MEDLYLFHNNQLLKESNFHLPVSNRSFRFGDSVFESVRMANGKICFLESHLERFIGGIKALKMDVPEELTVENIAAAYDKLQQQNNITAGGRARLTAYRNSGLTYKPDSNSASIIVELRPLDQPNYELNKKGVTLSIYTENPKPNTTFAQYKTGNSLIYTLASLFATEEGVDEALLVNDKGYLVEAVSSNIFLVKDDVLFTPPVTSGCIAGVMRRNLIELAKENGIKTVERQMKPEALDEADEVFLTNTINGVRWVMGHGKRRYYSKMAQHMIDILNGAVS